MKALTCIIIAMTSRSSIVTGIGTIMSTVLQGQLNFCQSQSHAALQGGRKSEDLERKKRLYREDDDSQLVEQPLRRLKGIEKTWLACSCTMGEF